MPILKRNNGILIYYEVIGPMEATETILLIGGLTRDHTIWRKTLPYLEKRYRIILPDNRDSGQSSTATTEYSISNLAEDISDLIEYLKIGSIHIAGHSMGGFMAFHLAAKHPDLIKTISLCSTAEKQTKAGITYLMDRIHFIDDKPSAEEISASRDDIVAVMNRIYSPESLTNESFIEEIMRFETNNPYPQTRQAFKRQAMACMNHDAESLLSDIHCPVFIVTGEHDKTFPPEIARTLSSKLKNATVTIIPSAGHMIQLEQPRLLSDALEKFIISNHNEPDEKVTMRARL